MPDRDTAATQQLVEYRAACKDCRAGLGPWTDHNATASLQAREHALGTSHDTVVQTRRTLAGDETEVPADG